MNPMCCRRSAECEIHLSSGAIRLRPVKSLRRRRKKYADDNLTDPVGRDRRVYLWGRPDVTGAIRLGRSAPLMFGSGRRGEGPVTVQGL